MLTTDLFAAFYNHNGEGTNVLFGDAHVEWIDKHAWPKVAADAGVAVVPSLASRP